MLDCACGIGLLAVGPVGRGFDVARHRRQPGDDPPHAREFGVPARVCAWEELPPTGDFDTVLCVGNSLPHARDRVRRAARHGGRAAARRSARPHVAQLGARAARRGYEVERGGRRALVTYAWSGDEVDVSVTVDGDTVTERLTVWPFTHEKLLADLRAAGLTADDEHLRTGSRALPRQVPAETFRSAGSLITNVRRRRCSRARLRRSGRCRRRCGAGLAGPGRGAPPRQSGGARARVARGRPHGV